MGWKEIWQSRSTKDLDLENCSFNELYLSLKKINGFDVVGEGLNIESLLAQHNSIENEIEKYFGEDNLCSVFEVGCGSGANLVLFAKKGHQCGGLDYSNTLIEIAQNVLNKYINYCNFQVDEAKNLPIEMNYDVLYANSVFSYFPSLEYANLVLEKMYQKTKGMIILVDIHDSEKEEAFLTFRRNIIPNYDEKYKGLHKLFFSKSFFEEFANRKNLKIYFKESNVNGYWNNNFVYNCYMYK